jgi:hypothetical protein
MNSERWQELEELYHAALAQEPARRHAFLTEACRGDADLLRELESLLAQNASTGALADQTAWASANELATRHTILKSGERLGPYKILGLLV